MQIAVTPFYEEVFQVHPLCRDRSINCFWHTHPLLMMRDPTTAVARLAPPSLGDFFAHSVLSNSRNFRQNRQLNTTVLMAFEGLYAYGVLPHKFRKLMDRADALVTALAASIPPTELETFKTVGELPAAARETLKDEVFAELRPAVAEYNRAMQQFCDSRDDCGTSGAVELGDAQWRELVAGQAPAELEFPFARAVHSDDLIAFARDNVMTTALAELGFYCLFVPRRNFEDGAAIPAPTTAHYCHR
jgi:hypothetical protein